MNFRKIATPIFGALLIAAAYRAYGWGGVAIAFSGVVMWMLLHFSRMTKVLSRTADRPVGYVGSAVMLNAKLKRGVTLLHVIAMTEALGERLSPEGEEPERWRWTDGTASSVTCEFVKGKLATWTLYRPAPDESSRAE